MTNPEPLVKVESLRVEIPTRREVLVALDNVSMEIYPGEILGVVGESGAGKSMTGNAIIGLLDPPAHVTAGSIYLNGRRIDNLSESEKRHIRGKEIGAIFQDPLTSLNPLFKIGDQLVETICEHRQLSVKQARELAVDLLKQTGIPAAESRIDDYPHHFSGGMRQRVVIALALAANPKLIIADEPTTALDVSIQAQIIDLLKGLCKQYGTAVMLVSHDMGVIAEAADRVAIMYAGRIVETGPVMDVIHRPMHPYTRGLMGAIPKISGDQSQTQLVQIPGQMPRLSEVPAGCAFHPRCPLADQICIDKRPEMTCQAGRSVACWKVSESVHFASEPFHVRDPKELASYGC